MIGLIVGSGMQDLSLESVRAQSVDTPFGTAEVLCGTLAQKPVALIERHGKNHCLAPHQVSSRANMWAMKSLGVKSILATGTVGGMSGDHAPGHLSVPNQIVDYTVGRESSFWGTPGFESTHIDFTEPFDEALRAALLEAGKALKIFVTDGGVYACTQGPRLETAAEVRRMIMDGCDMVGMTAMPEAALARELGIGYGLLCASVNWAAGLSGTDLTWDEIRQSMQKVCRYMQAVLAQAVARLPE